MEVLNYLLALIISFSGLFVGMFLGRIAKEELKQGKKYFILLQHLLFSLVIFFILLIIDNIYLALTAVLVFIFSYKAELSSKIAYPLLGLFFYFSSASREMILINSALTFLYGFPAGSLLKNKKDILFYSLFILIGIILFFLPLNLSYP